VEGNGYDGRRKPCVPYGVFDRDKMFKGLVVLGDNANPSAVLPELRPISDLSDRRRAPGLHSKDSSTKRSI
jgi:hypothetical protein